MQHKFQEILDQTGLKTSVVARDTGIPYNTLNDWRKGRTKKISLENVSKLAEYFHVSVASFLEEDDDPVLINVTKCESKANRTRKWLNTNENVSE